MNHDLELKLQAWLDGELSVPEARRFGQEMANDTAASGLAGELRSVKSALAGNELAVTVPETREFYWSKIQREIQRQAAVAAAAPTPHPSLWSRWLPSAAGFASLACVLVLALRPFGPPTFDEITATADGMEAVTFHDQSAGMTVVWLADTEDSQQQITSPRTGTPEAVDTDSEVEME